MDKIVELRLRNHRRFHTPHASSSGSLYLVVHECMLRVETSERHDCWLAAVKQSPTLFT